MVASAAIVGGVAFGYYKYKKPYANPLLGTLTEGQNALTPYVRIDKQGIPVPAGDGVADPAAGIGGVESESSITECHAGFGID